MFDTVTAHGLAVIPLGDMLLLGHPPPKLAKALAIIAAYLHPAFANNPGLKAPDISRRSCILSSLTIRDFLRKVGFADARCEACGLVVRGFEGEREFHSAGAVPETEGEGWPGHVVCLVQGFLIDATLYQIQRPVWPELPGMMAAPAPPFPLAPLGGDFIEGDRRITITWFPIANRSWKGAPDAHRDVRADAVKSLVEKMKGFRS